MIHLIYRSYGGENQKNRPPFYSKSLALASFVRAAERVEANVIYLNDGPIPRSRLSVMERTGEVIQLPGGPIGMRASYRAALHLPVERRWDDNDIVYFSEDDYLHVSESFSALKAAAIQLPAASYFALYGSTPRHPNPGEFSEGYWMPEGWSVQPDASVDGQLWVNVASTASTFGARLAALRADLPIFKQCMLPYRTRLLDHETCLLYQGFAPYRGWEVVTGRKREYPSTAWGYLRRYGLLPFRTALNVRARSRSADPHWLYAADPNFACHLTTSVMTPGRNWAAIAEEVAEWAQGNHVELPPVALSTRP